MLKGYLVTLLKRIIPTPIKSALNILGFTNLLNKYAVELAFQIEWAKDFTNNRSRVLEYWQKYRYLDEINAICKAENNMRILDVGCGISTVLHYMNGERYGIDPLANEYKKVYNYPEGINIQKGVGEDLPFPDEYFGVVFCSNVLDHVTDPPRTVDEIYRVLKASGYFVLTVEIFGEETQRDPAHPHSLTKEMLYPLFESKFKAVLEEEPPLIGLSG